MPRYGFMSIAVNPSNGKFNSFEHLYQTIGLNTGNLLFTNAVARQIEQEPIYFGFEFDPALANEQVDALIIPAANWVSEQVDFDHLAPVVEGLTIPVVLIGLGAQGSDLEQFVCPPKGTIRFLKAVFDRAHSVSVRGPHTAETLRRLGFENTVVTGCPSLYCDFQPLNVEAILQKAKKPFDLSSVLVHATRFSASHAAFARNKGVDRELFRFAYEHDLDILYQSEKEELALLYNYESADVLNDRLIFLMKEIYSASNWHELRDYVYRRGKAFLDIDIWSEYIQKYNYIYGTRLHGTIMALNSGVPATLAWHDSRTREMAEFACIPTLPASLDGVSEIELRRAYEGVELERYYKRREVLRDGYLSYLRENSIDVLRAH
ncbi:MAG: polysaccharide pyruvyl transferase family protein [Verrucomicrobiota bacterium]